MEMISASEYETLLASYRRRGGVITICPTAYAAPVVGALPDDLSRQAISDHARYLEERRIRRIPLRAELRNEQIHSSPAAIQVARPAPRQVRRKNKAVVTKDTEEKTPSPEAEMKSMTLIINGEETTRVKVGDGFAIYSRELNGRETVSIFDGHQSFRGTVELKAPRRDFGGPQG